MFGLDTVRASVSMKHITADVILRNLIKFPLQGVPLASIRRREKADLENVVYILLEKP